jgi:FHA domain
MLQPVSVALQFGFLAVLYLFLVWVTRSALRDLRRSDHHAAGAPGARADAGAPVDATGIHPASRAAHGGIDDLDPRLVVERAPGHTPGMEYDIGEGAILGRGEQAEIRLEDPFASTRHARLLRQGPVVVLEDMGSTNGTFLNEELLSGPQPLHGGDRVRIGDSEFTYVEGDGR